MQRTNRTPRVGSTEARGSRVAGHNCVAFEGEPSGRQRKNRAASALLARGEPKSDPFIGFLDVCQCNRIFCS